MQNADQQSLLNVGDAALAAPAAIDVSPTPANIHKTNQELSRTLDSRVRRQITYERTQGSRTPNQVLASDASG